MGNWSGELKPRRQSLAEVNNQRGIFQGDALSRLLFVAGIMPLNHILSKCTARYKLSKSQAKIKHLMYMVDIKPFRQKRKRTGNPNTNCKNIP